MVRHASIKEAWSILIAGKTLHGAQRQSIHVLFEIQIGRVYFTFVHPVHNAKQDLKGSSDR